MSRNSDTIRIAIIVERDYAACLPLALPYSVLGYPFIQVDFFQGGSREARPETGLAFKYEPEAVQLGLVADQLTPPRPLAELDPQIYHLILDPHNLTARLPGTPPEGPANLVTGPGAPVLESLLCQFYELRQKIEVNSGILLTVTDAVVTSHPLTRKCITNTCAASWPPGSPGSSAGMWSLRLNAGTAASSL